jgi:hypothetical protein
LQKDYYRLQAFFANLLPRDDLTAATKAEKAEHAKKEQVWLEKTAAIRAEIAKIEAPYRAKAAEDATVIFPDDVEAMIRKPAARRTPLEHQLAELAYRQVTYVLERIETKLKGKDKETVLALKRKLAEFDHLKPPPLPVAFAATDVGPTAPPTTIPKRSGPPIEPGVPSVLDEQPAVVKALPISTGRRSALANWLTDPANPLTARVMVNRVWQQHFGRGLATNASDFGKLGEAPSHPELLDWLADRFVKDGWSLKSLHRRIVLSATYRQASDHPDPRAARLADPENRLLWHAPVRRLDAEQVRDAVFAVAGDLDLTAGGPGSAASDPRRSIYTKVLRNTRDPLLDVFDAPLGFQSASARDTTTTPVQSLLLFNSPFLLNRARALADRLEREEPDEARRVDRAYRLAFGRPAAEGEVAAALQFVADQVKRVDPARSAAAAPFAAGKFPTRDGQAADVRLASRTAMTAPIADRLPDGDFTIEAFALPRTIAETAAVRTIASKWTGDLATPGWAFGVTGKKSRRKPQTVVVQLVGKTADGKLVEEAVFSDQHIQLNKPYYLAAAVKLATKSKPGHVTFFLKDLANDDEPLLTARVEHRIAGGLKNAEPLALGGRGAKGGSGFDGLIDDVRLSDAALDVGQLLYTREGTNKNTIGYWRFEPKPGAMTDAAGHGLDLTIGSTAPATPTDVKKTAWADLCHVLLNASEFLYVE